MSLKTKSANFRNRILAVSSINENLREVNKKIQILQDAVISLRDLNMRPISPIIQTIQIDQKTILTKIFTGIKIYLNPNDLAVSAHIALDGVWEKPNSLAWLAAVKPNDTVLDIGANFGYFGLLACQFTDRKKSKVIFFEANRNLIPYIKKSLSVNWMNEQSVLENLAISDKEGEEELNVLKDHIGSSSLQSVKKLNDQLHKKMYINVEEKIKVKTVTIDSYCKKNGINEVNLIKMDIEGYEEKAYFGMRETIKKNKNISLFVEFTKDSYENPEEFYNTMLKDFGNIFIISENGQIVKPKDSSYRTVIGEGDDWVMPIFSKNPKLDGENNVIL